MLDVFAAGRDGISYMHLPADDHYELPGTYVLGPPPSRRAPRVAVAGIVVFAFLALAVVLGAMWAGLTIFGD